MKGRIPRPIAWTLIALASLLAAGIAFPGTAQASVSCSVGTASISFATAGTATGTLSYTCSASIGETLPSVSLCAYPGTPSAGTAAQPRLASGANTLAFNLYTDAGHTAVWNQTNRLATAFTIPAFGLGGSTSGSFIFYGAIPNGQNPPPGNYAMTFAGSVLGFTVSGSCLQNTVVLLSARNGQSFTLSASAVVPKSCAVTATGDANLGPVAAASGAASGAASITVNCTTGTPYTIGLAPSNGSTTGLGQLTGTGTNTDRPAYQLRAGSAAGPAWGNTAAVGAAGNGVAGTGTGSAQVLTVFASVPSTSFTPDQYRDTVTVTVNY